MRLYHTAKTAMKDLVIDYIEVNLKNGKTISLTWDESEFGIEVEDDAIEKVKTVADMAAYIEEKM